jgi:hypothetical protein
MSDPPVDSRVAHLRVSSSVKSQVRGSGRLSVTGELRASMTGEGDDGYKVAGLGLGRMNIENCMHGMKSAC